MTTLTYGVSLQCTPLGAFSPCSGTSKLAFVEILRAALPPSGA
jgi:hypothetical protein